ncbi:hypothetical protein K8R14_04220 [bacterium]|nr:hypothetical protein [bacterium]
MLNKDILHIVAETLHPTTEISLETLTQIFEGIILDKKKFNHAYLTLYMYEKFCKTRDVQTRKTSARDFEDFVAAISNGEIADSSTRHNSNNHDILVENKAITEWVINNKREKADINYPNNYSITIKTLVESNKEINMGAFEKTALFAEFGVVQYLEERRSSTKGTGLGSKPQLFKLLSILQSNGSWDNFANRFINMAKHIYSDDIIVFIKSEKHPLIYLISSDIFNKKMAEAVQSPQSFINIVNRWEGNNIRMNRDSILHKVIPLQLNFSYLNKHIISQINTNLSTITKNFVLYIEDNHNKEIYKQEIFELCEETLSGIDNKLSELI